MVTAFLIDDMFQIKNIIPVSEFEATVNILNVESFTASIPNIEIHNVSEGDILSIFDGNSCIYSGIIKYISFEDDEVEGYDLRYAMKYYLVSDALGISHVARNKYKGTFKATVQNFVNIAFPNATVSYSFYGDYTSDQYSIDTRTKYIYEVIRNACILEDAHIRLLAVGNGKIKCVCRSCDDRTGTVNLITGISASQIDRIVDKRNQYNQILGLGAGTGGNRDSVFIDNSTSGNKCCYIYDLRDDIDHDELATQTAVKFKELSSENRVEFSILQNNIASYGSDYYLGDKVTFISDTGKKIKDKLTEVTITMTNGQLISAYEAAIGRGKYTLTQKIKELKEGGYK